MRNRIVRLLALWSLMVALPIHAEVAAPGLELAFTAEVEVGSPVEVGIVPGGSRRLIPISGGSFSGPLLKGRILPGGADHQLLQADGFTQLEARYVLQTDAGDRIYVINRGVRYGAPEILAKLNAGERVDPALIYFRTAALLETSAPKLQWLNHTLFVCVGERYPDKVLIRFYKVL